MYYINRVLVWFPPVIDFSVIQLAQVSRVTLDVFQQLSVILSKHCIRRGKSLDLASFTCRWKRTGALARQNGAPPPRPPDSVNTCLSSWALRGLMIIWGKRQRVSLLQYWGQGRGADQAFWHSPLFLPLILPAASHPVHVSSLRNFELTPLNLEIF